MSAFQNILAFYIPLNLCSEIIGLEKDTTNQVTGGQQRVWLGVLHTQGLGILQTPEV